MVSKGVIKGVLKLVSRKMFQVSCFKLKSKEPPVLEPETWNLKLFIGKWEENNTARSTISQAALQDGELHGAWL